MSRASLPSEETREELLEAIAAATDLVESIENLARDERWRIWNLGGAAFDRPQFRGPGVYTSDDFIRYSKLLLARLKAVDKSFEHRMDKDAERAAKRA